ncbi:hypothetical protein A2U01_0111411, partial [Trifolium medium]|nr:hypothetical protein [Trifolium medium]
AQVEQSQQPLTEPKVYVIASSEDSQPPLPS